MLIVLFKVVWVILVFEEGSIFHLVAAVVTVTGKTWSHLDQPYPVADATAPTLLSLL